MMSPTAPPARLPERSRVKTHYEKQLPEHKTALQKLSQEVRQILEQQGLTPAIKSRVKSFDAFYDKLRKLNSGGRRQRLAPVNDFFGLRIICPFLEDIETVANLIGAHYEVVETEFKASQHSFREFGYDSVHLAIRLETGQKSRLLAGVRKVCEIQLRTILQDAWAEVEHELVYKSDISLPNESIRRKLAALNANLTLSDLIFQEIRDYQKELRRHGHKRRALAGRSPQGAGDIAISHPTAADKPSPVTPITRSMGSDLEKIMLRALEAHSSHDLETAIALYGQLLSMRLDRKVRSLVYNHRGMAYFAMGHHQRALQDFNSAVRYDPESDRGFANRGLCQRVLKKYERAIEDFSQAVKLNPNRPDGYFGRAQTYHDMQQFAPARDDCEKALSIHSGYQPARDLLKTLRANSD